MTIDKLVENLLHDADWLESQKGVRCLADDCRTAAEILKEKESHATPEWISVNDRLPGKPTKCVVCQRTNHLPHLEITYYDGRVFYSDLCGGRATHWVPLPDIPEKE